MDINEVDQSEDGFEEVLTENSADAGSSYSSDTFGEQEIHPRVGDEYQAVIPTLLASSERLKYFSSPYDSQPVLVDKEVTADRDEAVEEHAEVDTCMTYPKHCVKQNTSASDKKELNAKGDCLDQRRVINGCSAVPGWPVDPWSESDVDSFLLGLYFFGKNFLLVKRFMENKEMGQILSFYYEKFFSSAKYRQWVDCRKVKGRKCIIGRRLLTGSRQRELFSRLLPRINEESRNTLLEAYKAFCDGKTSVEEYISTLKNTVGIHNLVEAVAIGKGRKDLTVMAMEASRTTQKPSSKACSALTYDEIVKYLTGNLRMSKARSIDLFWEAVWPRLLEKGWHSEESKSETYRDSRNCLVFIVPGIMKFKRKLLKGHQYFDSVCDVLKKVGSEPELIMLEDEENDNKISEKENGLGTVQNSDEDSGSDHDQNRYLKPRFSSGTANYMKFTVVDTSLFREDELPKVMELKSLPETSRTAEVRDEVEGPEKDTDLSDKLRDFVVRNRSKKRAVHNSFDPPPNPVENHSDHCNVYLSADNQPLPVEHEAARDERADPVVKRRKLSVCSKSETEYTAGDIPMPSVVSPNKVILRLPAPSKKTVQSDSHAHAHDGVSPANSSAVNTHGEKNNNGDSNEGSCSSATSSESYEKSIPLIDLNKPAAAAETEVNGQVTEKVKTEESNDSCQDGSCGTSTRLENTEPVGGSTVDGFCSEEPANNRNARRHGTRARPMSTKALEALESSFLKATKKRSSADSQEPRVSRRPRAKTSILGNCSTDTVDAVKDDDTEAVRPNGIHSAVNDVLSDALSYL